MKKGVENVPFVSIPIGGSGSGSDPSSSPTNTQVWAGRIDKAADLGSTVRCHHARLEAVYSLERGTVTDAALCFVEAALELSENLRTTE